MVGSTNTTPTVKCSGILTMLITCLRIKTKAYSGTSITHRKIRTLTKILINKTSNSWKISNSGVKTNLSKEIIKTSTQWTEVDHTTKCKEATRTWMAWIDLIKGTLATIMGFSTRISSNSKTICSIILTTIIKTWTKTIRTITSKCRWAWGKTISKAGIKTSTRMEIIMRKDLIRVRITSSKWLKMSLKIQIGGEILNSRLKIHHRFKLRSLSLLSKWMVWTWMVTKLRRDKLNRFWVSRLQFSYHLMNLILMSKKTSTLKWKAVDS